VWGRLRSELRVLFAGPWARLRRRGLRAIPFTVVSVLLTLTFWFLWKVERMGPFVHAVGGVRADLPWWEALYKTPLSLFVPAPDLPVWGALAQVLLVFGLAELTLGRVRTLVLAYVATVFGTFSARPMIALGEDHWLGVSDKVGHVLDTGPSAAVVALVVAVTFVRRAWIFFTLIWAAMIAEVIVKPNLAGREHLVAMAAVLVFCVVFDRKWLAGPAADCDAVVWEADKASVRSTRAQR
jgi:hypothetical protein